MSVSVESIKVLRARTGISIAECKKALEMSGGDIDQALAALRSRSAEVASKKQGRALGAGVVASYVHKGAQVGAMVLLSCETDFVAKNEAFSALAHELAMQAAAMRPKDTDELLTGPFIKDTTRTVGDLIAEAAQKFGERMEVSEVVVFSVS